jgi:hypothetical protein
MKFSFCSVDFAVKKPKQITIFRKNTNFNALKTSFNYFYEFSGRIWKSMESSVLGHFS